MVRVFITIAIIGLFQLSRVNCFKFSITKDITQINALDKKMWCFVEITEGENFAVKVDVPVDISYSGIFIYFANEQKEILKVNLNESVEGKFYEIPYKLTKEMKAGKTETIEKDNFHQVIGEFPKFWLPNNSTKISAAVECVDKRILNYYGIQNFKISFPDLMILEEFKNFTSH